MALGRRDIAAAYSLTGYARPPIVFGNGFVVYGAHANGADIDPDELRALAGLVKNAAVAYDHLEAQALRARIAVLEAMVLTKTAT